MHRLHIIDAVAKKKAKRPASRPSPTPTRYVYAKDTDRSGRYYIQCGQCRKKSYHADDIANNYCGHCHRFHDDILKG